MTEERCRIEMNIEKIEKWLCEPNISQSRKESLNDLLTRYYSMLDRLNG